jgi:hypothetical protein
MFIFKSILGNDDERLNIKTEESIAIVIKRVKVFLMKAKKINALSYDNFCESPVQYMGIY